MKITIDTEPIIQDIYAESAIGAVLGRSGNDKKPHLLNPDQHDSLLRMVAQSASDVCSMTALEQSEPIGEDAQQTLSIKVNCTEDETASIRQHLQAAISAATMQRVALAEGDNARADRYGSKVQSCVAAISDLLSKARPLTARRNY